MKKLNTNYWFIFIIILLINNLGLSKDFSDVFVKEREIILKDSSKISVSSIQAMDIDSEKNIWIIDWDLGVLIKFNRYGNNPVLIAKKGKGPGELEMPESLFIDNSNHIYVVNLFNRVSIFNENGKFINSFIPVDGHYPTTCIVGKSGKFIILGGRGREKGDMILNKMIHYYSFNEKYIRSFYQINEIVINKNLSRYCSAYFDISEKDNVYAIQPVSYKISVFNLDGELINIFGEKQNYYKSPKILTKKVKYNKNLFDDWKKNFTYAKNIFVDGEKVIVCFRNYYGNHMYKYYIDIYNLSGDLILSGIESHNSLEQVKQGKYYFTKIVEGKKVGYFKNAIDIYTLK